jgi:hypothetical protein
MCLLLFTAIAWLGRLADLQGFILISCKSAGRLLSGD